MYTLTELRNKVKRRVGQLRATTSSSTESEVGNIFANNAIDDAINAGRKHIMVTILDADMWGRHEWLITTVLNTEEYSLDKHCLRVDGVVYDVTAVTGARNSNSYQAMDVKDLLGETSAIDDTYNAPSITNPKYRLTNKGLKIIVSTDGSVTAGKYILVEGIHDIIDLAEVDDDSDLPDVLDELVIEWAVYVVCQPVLPNLATIAQQNYYLKAKTLNEQFMLRRRS